MTNKTNAKSNHLAPYQKIIDTIFKNHLGFKLKNNCYVGQNRYDYEKLGNQDEVKAIFLDDLSNHTHNFDYCFQTLNQSPFSRKLEELFSLNDSSFVWNETMTHFISLFNYNREVLNWVIKNKSTKEPEIILDCLKTPIKDKHYSFDFKYLAPVFKNMLKKNPDKKDDYRNLLINHINNSHINVKNADFDKEINSFYRAIFNDYLVEEFKESIHINIIDSIIDPLIKQHGLKLTQVDRHYIKNHYYILLETSFSYQLKNNVYTIYDSSNGKQEHITTQEDRILLLNSLLIDLINPKPLYQYKNMESASSYYYLEKLFENIYQDKVSQWLVVRMYGLLCNKPKFLHSFLEKMFYTKTFYLGVIVDVLKVGCHYSMDSRYTTWQREFKDLCEKLSQVRDCLVEPEHIESLKNAFSEHIVHSTMQDDDLFLVNCYETIFKDKSINQFLTSIGRKLDKPLFSPSPKISLSLFELDKQILATLSSAYYINTIKNIATLIHNGVFDKAIPSFYFIYDDGLSCTIGVEAQTEKHVEKVQMLIHLLIDANYQLELDEKNKYEQLKNFILKVRLEFDTDDKGKATVAGNETNSSNSAETMIKKSRNKI